jgi:hypothetical protein
LGHGRVSDKDVTQATAAALGAMGDDAALERFAVCALAGGVSAGGGAFA